ncbi:MAG: AAA family ATPase [Gammaproteobacteria bacterium]|nr:AAA family ATPase [Gammaproteobacteria bacterium]
MNKELQLTLLGAPQIILNGSPVAMEPREQALLYYLAVTGRPHRRAFIASLLQIIPDTQNDPKSSLRVTLANLRKRIDKHYILTDKDTVAFNRKAAYWLDVKVLKDALRATPKTTKSLQEGLRLYRGRFLEGFQLAGETLFEEWCSGEQLAQHNAVVQALHTLVMIHKTQGNYAAAMEFANRLLTLEPWREETHRLLMLLLACTGQRSAALMQYSACRRMLQKKLNMQPTSETARLYKEIKASQADTQHKTVHIAKDCRYGVSVPQYKEMEEHRQMTVMYCHWRDLPEISSPALSRGQKESTALEVWHAQRQHSQRMCMKTIARFKGHVLQHSSSGILVAFACPLAYEESAQRAILTGRMILRSLAPHQTSHGLAVGVHTGSAILEVNAIGTYRDVKVISRSLDIAEQLARHAQTGTMVISEAVYTLVRGLFQCRLLEPSGRRIVDRIAYRVLDKNRAHNRLAAAQACDMPLTPLAGRQEELGSLFAQWAQVQKGIKKAVLISGEAGIGKARLADALIARVSEENFVALKCQCSAVYRDCALYPVSQLLQQMPDEDLSPEENVERLAAIMAKITRTYSQTELKGSGADLLALFRDEPEKTVANANMRRLLNMLPDLLLVSAKRRPILLAVEDLQWADDFTLALLDRLFERYAQEPQIHLFIVLTARPEFRPTWPDYAYVNSIGLSRLSERDIGTLIDKLGHVLPHHEEMRRFLIAQSDGVPLFAEELAEFVSGLSSEQAQAALSEEAGNAPALPVPPRLYDLLVAPLDASGPAKQAALLGAVLGREFAYEELRALWTGDESTLQKCLSKLVELRLICPRAQGSRYQFKYALTRAAAYHSLLKQRIVEINALREKFRLLGPNFLAHGGKAATPQKTLLQMFFDPRWH